MYNAELQMLREFFWRHAPHTICVFCGKPIVDKPAKMTFGHRRHPKVRVRYTVHHENEDRSDNSDTNLRDCHSTCHHAYHKQLLLAAGKGELHAGKTLEQGREKGQGEGEGQEEEREGKVG